MNEKLTVRKFREYLQIKTVHPNPDYASAVSFLDDYAEELGIDAKHVKIDKDREVVVMTIPGRNKKLPSILLNSHVDVVPVFEDDWKFDPWGAHKDDKGNIYGRGAQDMKCVGIQYLEALRILTKTKKQTFERTIHLTFVPDEEINNGDMGMKLFLDTPEFSVMNVGLALDEGIANSDNNYSVFYGERLMWVVHIKCKGNPGHGSRFIQGTAAEKLQNVIDNFLAFRTSEENRLSNNPGLTLGDVTTVNLTMIKGGVHQNVVPGEIVATFDIRLPPTIDLKALEEKIASWCNEAGNDVTSEFECKDTCQTITTADQTNPWWRAFTFAFHERNLQYTKEIFCGCTDGRFLRERGYQVIGFSPMRNTPILLHDNNEFLNESVFLEGIELYCDIISAIANLKC
uniref:aminoacylase-1A-like n=1 Tax=Styela clava TaxID=7725 RepID=UPI001939D918|nr:aminoacylase-1A-like [Styela clava]